jgi:hypothetical protein
MIAKSVSAEYKRKGGIFNIMEEIGYKSVITFIEPKEKLSIEKALQNLPFQEIENFQNVELIVENENYELFNF